MMRHVPYALLFAAALAAAGAAQTEKPTSRSSAEGPPEAVFDRATAGRLASAIDAIIPQSEETGDLVKIAQAVAVRFAQTDTKTLGNLEKRLARLDDDEKEIERQIDSWKKGMPADLEPWWDANDAATRVDRAAIELEEMTLLALKTKFAEAQDARRRETEKRKELAAAHEPSKTAKIMLSLLDTVPQPPPEAPKATPVAKSAYPDRLARALYKADDFVGALAQFRAVKPEELSDSDHYSMARCLEECGDTAGALTEIEKITGLSQSAFWKERGEKMKAWLMRDRTIKDALKRGDQ